VKPLRLLLFFALSAAFCLCLASPESRASTTPGITITATNVSISDMGTAVSHFTVTSVNGFTGRVGVICKGLDSNIVPDLVLPDCTFTTQNYVLTANGSASGIMTFYPPNNIPSTVSRGGSPRQPGPALPIAGALAAAGIFCFRIRRKRSGWPVLPLLAIVGLAGLAGVTGCIGHGGLAMTHGDWGYTITATPVSGATPAVANIAVVVH